MTQRHHHRVQHVLVCSVQQRGGGVRLDLQQEGDRTQHIGVVFLIEVLLRHRLQEVALKARRGERPA